MVETNQESARRLGSCRQAAAVLGFVAVLAGAAASFAETQVSAAVAPPAGPANVRVVNGQLALSLDEAVELALTRNLGLRVQRYDREVSRLGINQALGIYDLNLNAGAQISDQKAATVNLVESGETKQRGLQLGLSQLLPSGGSAAVSFTNGRGESNNQFVQSAVAFSSGLSVTITQPLLRDFGRQATERLLIQARVADEIATQTFVQQVVASLQTVQDAYWQLVDARFQLRVAEAGLDLAKKLHDQNRIRVDVGTLAPLELVQSEAGVATREEEIIRAKQAVGDAQDQLRALLNLDEPNLWTLEILPETDPATEHPEIQLEQALTAAREQRPELVSLRLAQKNLDVNATYLRNQMRPRLDLRANYAANGIASKPDGWTDAFDRVTARDFPSWSATLGFAIPLQNRSARALKTEADLQVQRGLENIKDLELQVATEVRSAARLVETAAQAIASAQVSVRLEEKNLEAEQKKYENGLSTSFNVLQIQDALTSARSRLAGAVTGYRRALINLYRTTGQLVAESGVKIE